MTAARDIRLDGCNIIVTGAARGIGKCMGLALARAGANVVLADLDGDVARQAAAEVEGIEGAGRCEGTACDIRELDQCASLVERTIERFGSLDVLVNNAAIGQHYLERRPGTKSLLFHEADPEGWAEVIKTNVNGSFFLAHHAARHMAGRGWGRIVNVTTSLGTIQRYKNSPYGVSKGALETATLIWAQDLEGTGVTVNSLIPGGAVDTDFVNDESRRAAEASGRPLLKAEVMIPPILWLASKASDGVTGGRFVGKLWAPEAPVDEAVAAAREEPVLRPPPASR